MKKSNIFILLIMLYAGLFFISCDETTAPNNVLEDAPSIRNLEINPNAVEFDKNRDGFNDTTLVISISAETANNSQGYIPYFSVTDNNGELFTEGDLTPAETDGEIYNTELQINTSTTSFEQYLVNVMISDESGNGNYAQSTLRIVGIPNNPPVILEAKNDEDVEIPPEGEEVTVRFTAKVTDPDGQDNIDRVMIEFINEDGSRLVPEDNILLDDGDDNPQGGSGDLVAGDSVYTRAFIIESYNTPNERTVQYFAIDRAGLSSDTLETDFNIIE